MRVWLGEVITWLEMDLKLAIVLAIRGGVRNFNVRRVRLYLWGGWCIVGTLTDGAIGYTHSTFMTSFLVPIHDPRL